MDLTAFRSSLDGPEPPVATGPLRALWYEAKGDWRRAHEIVQDDNGPEAAWVHAYLHRVEGDLSNARYWYGQAEKPASKVPLQEEWAAIVKALLAGA